MKAREKTQQDNETGKEIREECPISRGRQSDQRAFHSYSQATSHFVTSKKIKVSSGVYLCGIHRHT